MSKIKVVKLDIINFIIVKDQTDHIKPDYYCDDVSALQGRECVGGVGTLDCPWPDLPDKSKLLPPSLTGLVLPSVPVSAISVESLCSAQ